MKRVCIIGNFGSDKGRYDGQTIKTYNIYKALVNNLENRNVSFVNTNNGLKKLPILILKTILAVYKNRNIVMLPAQNGVQVFSPILRLLSRFVKCKMHYVVIGGWLPEFVEGRSWLKKALMNFDYIYVETNIMKKKLMQMGFKNIVVLPNCKELEILKPEELVYATGEPYKLCTFSRVMKEKGIEDAVDAVMSVNKQLGRVVYSLDIYGQVDANQVKWFDDLQTRFPEYIKYKGTVDFDKTTSVLKNYFMLLFPTRFYTEGIPGTIIDAYAAGVPVIYSKWENYRDLVDDKVGYGYEFNSKEALEKMLLKIKVKDIENMGVMKRACIIKAEKYIPKTVIKQITNNLL